MSRTDENVVMADTISFGALCIATLLTFAPIAARAHGAGLDSLSGHHDRKAGGYHCHCGSLAGQQFRSKADTLASSRSLNPAPDRA